MFDMNMPDLYINYNKCIKLKGQIHRNQNNKCKDLLPILELLMGLSIWLLPRMDIELVTYDYAHFIHMRSKSTCNTNQA